MRANTTSSRQKLEELTQFNLAHLNMVYANAIERAAEEFEQCATLHSVVKKLVKWYAPSACSFSM
jgi:hypothetical protein